MLVREQHYKDVDAATHFGPPGAECFFCAEPLTTPFIMWQAASRLVLHPRCAVDLVIRLMRDVHEFQHTSRTHVEYVQDHDVDSGDDQPWDR